MKKFFSLFCALAIVLGASGAPVKNARAEKFAMEHAKEVKAQKSLNLEKATIASQKAPLSQKAQAAKIAKAKKEATDVTIGSWEVVDWGSDGELYLYAEDSTIAFYFDLIYGGDAEDLVPGKEYKVEDVYVSESTGEQYASIFHDGEWYYGIKELSVTKTIDDKNLVHFVGSVLDSLDGKWTFHYDEEVFIPTGEVVEHAFKNIASISYLSNYGQWSVKVQDKQFAFRMDLNEKSSESAIGEYNSADGDFDIDYTTFSIFDEKGNETKYNAVEASAVISESNDSILIAIDFLCKNGVRYKATAFVATPTVQEQADFIASDLDIDDSYFNWFGIVYINAYNDDATLSLTIYPESVSDLSGEYLISQTDTLANASGSIKTADGEFDLFSGEFVVSKGDAGYVVTGKVLATNNVEYNLNIMYVKPEPTRQAELTIDGLELSFDFESETPWWQLYGYNADSTIMVTVSPTGVTQFAGSYKGEDLYPAYTYILTDITYDGSHNMDKYNYFKLIDAELNVSYTEADSTMVISGKYVGRNLNNRNDIPEFTINFTGRIPTPEVSDMTFSFAEEEDGITITPSNEDKWDYYIVSQEEFEKYGADSIAESIYSNRGNLQAISGEKLLSFEDIANNIETIGIYYIVVWGAGKRNVTTDATSYKFEYEGCTQYDAKEGNDFIVDFEEFNINENLKSSGVLIVDAKKEDGSCIHIEFAVPAGAEGLATGEYPVMKEGEVPFVYAGYINSNTIYGSYAGILTEQGKIEHPRRLFVDGKVTISKDGSINVDVVNCAGAKIKATGSISVSLLGATCAEAAAAMPANKSTTTEETYVVTGYITETNGTISREQQCFWMDDELGTKKTIQGYWCNLPEGEKDKPLKFGDKITVTGKIMNYNNTPEIKNGKVAIIKRVEMPVDTITVSEALQRIQEGNLQACVVKGEVIEPYINEKAGNAVCYWMADIDNPNDSIQAFKMNGANDKKYNSLSDLEFVAGDDILVHAKSLGLYHDNNMNVDIPEINCGYFIKKIGHVLVVSCNNLQGIVSEGGIYKSGSTCTISATANYGYHFAQWSDGNTDNPRTIELTQDTTFTAEFAPNQYSINVSCNTKFGHIEGENGEFDYLTEHEYEVVANYGYHFVRWSDGNRENPRTITVNQDISINAEFAKNSYTIYDHSNRTRGYVKGVGTYEYLDKVILKPIPEYGYHFAQWSDGKIKNPRTFVITQDTTFTAEFVIAQYGTCGDDNALTWIYDDQDILTITGNGALNSNYTFGLEAPESMQKVVIESGVSSVGNGAFKDKTTLKEIVISHGVNTIADEAFAGCTEVTTLTLGANLQSIGDNAFNGCKRIDEITVYAERVIDITATTFANIGNKKYVYVNVPEGSLRKYQRDDYWSEFDLRVIGATATTVVDDEVNVEPTNNTADLTWPAVENAATYELTIKDKDGNVICTLVFNAQGQLISIAFAAPGRGQSSGQIAGFTFTVTGLDSGSEYGFTMEAKDSQGEVLDTKEGTFTTTGGTPTAMDNASVDFKPAKVIRNGQLFILREGKTYTLQGQEVR